MEKKVERHLGRKILFLVLAVVVVIMALDIVTNRFSGSYHDLSASDRKIFSELDAYRKADKKSEIWRGFNLEDKTIVAFNGMTGPSYIINPKQDIHSIFAKKLAMPDDMELRGYRISRLAFQTLLMKADAGYFNEIGKTYKVFGNEVYFTKYNKKDSIEKRYTSKHYISLLSHEAFHYYMQRDWKGGERFSGKLSSEDMGLLEAEYRILAKVQTELVEKSPDKGHLLALAREYISTVEKRIAANPGYLEKELAMETAEGTASYVGIKAAEAAGYDLGVMYFDNMKNVSFSDVVPVVNAGKVEKGFLADRMPYETGAQLCFLLEALEGTKGWQEELNQQTSEKPVTLYDVIKKAVQ